MMFGLFRNRKIRITLEYDGKVAQKIALLKLWDEKASTAEIFSTATATLDLIRRKMDEGAEVIFRMPDGQETTLSLTTAS